MEYNRVEGTAVLLGTGFALLGTGKSSTEHNHPSVLHRAPAPVMEHNRGEGTAVLLGTGFVLLGTGKFEY